MKKFAPQLSPKGQLKIKEKKWLNLIRNKTQKKKNKEERITFLKISGIDKQKKIKFSFLKHAKILFSILSSDYFKDLNECSLKTQKIYYKIELIS